MGSVLRPSVLSFAHRFRRPSYAINQALPAIVISPTQLIVTTSQSRTFSKVWTSWVLTMWILCCYMVLMGHTQTLQDAMTCIVRQTVHSGVHIPSSLRQARRGPLESATIAPRAWSASLDTMALR